MQNTNTNDWLSAQQAVQPDGTEATNLPLINKKLPPLVSVEGKDELNNEPAESLSLRSAVLR